MDAPTPSGSDAITTPRLTEVTPQMVMEIQRDQRRFEQIVRGRIRDNLRKYITHGEMIGRSVVAMWSAFPCQS